MDGGKVPEVSRALHLTPDILRAAYALLASCQPFHRWNLPDSEDVKFNVVRSLDLRGWYVNQKGTHTIAISSGCCALLDSLLKITAHEMLHLHQKQSGMESPHAQHNAAFNKLAAQICEIHGWDVKLF